MWKKKRQALDEWDSDTDTVGGVSDAEVTEVVEPTVEEVPVPDGCESPGS